MPATTVDFSVKEAAAIVGVSELAVRKAIVARTVAPRATVNGLSIRYRFAPRDLVFMKLITGFPLALRRSDKIAIRALVRGSRPSAGRWSLRDRELVAGDGGVEIKVPIESLQNEIVENLRVYEAGRRRIESRSDVLDGEPVFIGTRIPLAHVATLFAKGVSIAEMKEDFPRLNDDDLAYARIVARMKRNPGRPRKPITLLRNGEPVATIDCLVEAREVTPR